MNTDTLLDPAACAASSRAAGPALGRQDWPAVERALHDHGYAALPSLISSADCERLAALYPREDGYRTRIQMARHGFGRGEYKYFAYPLPSKVQALRQQLYRHLVAIANDWNRQLGQPAAYPDDLPAFLSRCHAAGQERPTPLILQYGPGDYNCLHQDLYGDHVFPLQVAILLSAPGEDFTGGEFVMTQSIGSGQRQADVVPLRQGDGVAFAVHSRPVPGKRGQARRAIMRHGVSRVHTGHRHTLGLIFHDSR